MPVIVDRQDALHLASSRRPSFRATRARTVRPTASLCRPFPRRCAISPLLGGDAGYVSYPYYLINGRVPAAPTTFTPKPGQRIRIWIVNAGSDTAFRVALGGHTMTVTHTDGYPVVPTDVDALLIGIAERYVTVTAGDGVFTLVALAEGKNAVAPRPAVHRGRDCTRGRLPASRAERARSTATPAPIPNR